MKYLTNEKLVIVGAAGMIGSNMAQTALMLGLTNNLCLHNIELMSESSAQTSGVETSEGRNL